MSLLFRLEHVSFSSRGILIIDDISLEIECGKTTAFIGKSGSGKSTLLKLSAGLLQPTKGTVYFGTTDLNTLNRMERLAFRKTCSFMFQDSALWANQNILQNLSLPLQIHFPQMTEDERLTRIQNVCSRVGYTRPLTLRPADLSMGEQKQAGFARALICEPNILFLDECTESLDRKSREIMCGILDAFVQKGNTVVYVSHENSFITRYPGTMYIIENGIIKRKTDSRTEADE